MKCPEVKSFEECESPELGRQLYNWAVQSLSFADYIYDEIGGNGFDWHVLLLYQRTPYLIKIDSKGNFHYRAYKNMSQATKAWDHVCMKFEKWYIKTNG